MSYIFLQEQGEESSAECFSDIPAYVLSRLSLTAGKYCSQGSETESCKNSPSGMTSEPLTGSHGEGLLMSSAGDSRVRTSVRPAKEKDLAGNGLDYGQNLAGSLAKYDPLTRLWKTHQCLLSGEWEPFSGIWPRSGIIKNGLFVGAITFQNLPYYENASGYLPAPMARDGTTCGGMDREINGRDWNLRDWYHKLMRGTVGTPARRRNARFWEWLMDWPDNWTESTPLETDKFRQWLHSHGGR